MAESVAAETFEFDNFWVEADYSARRVFAGGEPDLATCPSLVDTVADLIALRAGHVVIVLDDITFIDAHTFGALVRISNHQHPIQGQSERRQASGLGLADALPASATRYSRSS